MSRTLRAILCVADPGFAVEVLKQLTVLALRTLRTFDFGGQTLTKFTQQCIVPYLTDEDEVVREVRTSWSVTHPRDICVSRKQL